MSASSSRFQSIRHQPAMLKLLDLPLIFPMKTQLKALEHKLIQEFRETLVQQQHEACKCPLPDIYLEMLQVALLPNLQIVITIRKDVNHHSAECFFEVQATSLCKTLNNYTYFKLLYASVSVSLHFINPFVRNVYFCSQEETRHLIAFFWNLFSDIPEILRKSLARQLSQQYMNDNRRIHIF